MYQQTWSDWNATHTYHQFRRIGKTFDWKSQAAPRFQQYFPHVLFLGNLYLFSVLIYKQYFFDPTLAHKPTSPLIKNVARVWNVVWSVFSAAGFLGTFPCTCRVADANLPSSLWLRPCIFWNFLYCWTKPLELIDTLLLMAAGRDVRLVHWSHHVITMLFTWFAARNFILPASVFSTLNFGMHAVMYGYYFLVSFACWRRPLKRYAFVITWLQMAQFVVCLYSLYHFYDLYTTEAFVASAAMYTYYLVLFAQLYRERFVEKTATHVKTQ